VIDWWAERLYYFCYEEFELGVFTDQRWMDLAPALFDCVHIDRNPSLNVASWNVSRRQVSFETTARAWTVDGQPLTFFHFSGYNGGTHDRIVDRYQALNSDLKRLSELYRSSCESWRNKYPELSQSAWTLELHRDGTKITPSQRRAAVQQLRSSKASKTIDPFGVPLAHDGMDESLFGKGPSELLAIASAAKRELSGIYRSKSWKLTAPLRKVMRSLKN
jgi:hypothetical protein